MSAAPEHGHPAASVYAPTGIHREHLDVKLPFPIGIDLTAIDERRPEDPSTS